jgi:large subunit ribosomal protein L14
MIQVQSLLKISDNSGAKLARCIRILKKGKNSRYGFIGDLVVLSIQKIRSKNKLTSKVKKGDVIFGVIVKTKFSQTRKSGLSFSSLFNSAVLFNFTKQFKPVATRVLGLVPREIRSSKFSKLVSLSSGLV